MIAVGGTTTTHRGIHPNSRPGGLLAEQLHVDVAHGINPLMALVDFCDETIAP